MKANDVLTRYEFLSRMLMTDLSKDLKVKLVSMRVSYGKVKRAYDEDFKEFAQGLVTPEFETLRDKSDKTEEEVQQWKTMVMEFNDSYNKYVISRISEDVDVKEYTITEEELEEIIAANVDNDVDINGNHFTGGDFVENISILFS